MANTISKSEVLKVAQLSNVIVYEHEIPAFEKQLDAVLSYAARVSEVGKSEVEENPVVDMKQNSNRKDEVCRQNAEIVLSQVPVRQGLLIIVPMILEGV
jgi:aspartyl/glutamyl-tRNA(Asn/Gln) amidotransferase C subunit